MRVGRFAAFALLLFLCACGSIGYHFEAPRLSIVKVEMLKGDLSQQQLRVRVHVANPNDRPLPVHSVSCEIEIAGEKFAHGESEQPFTVPAQGESDFDVAVTANAANAFLRLAVGSLRTDKVDYRMVGRVQLSGGLVRSVPFDKQGSFSLR